MDLPVYIGSEVSAQGYRLAGMDIRVVTETSEDLPATIERARKQAPLVMLDAALAERLPTELLETLLADLSTPLVIVPDIRGNHAMPDLEQLLRRELGVLE